MLILPHRKLGMAVKEDLRKLCTTLPVPLAELVRRALNGKSAVERHHCAFYLAEATLKLAAAVLLLRGVASIEHSGQTSSRATRPG
ncbi:MAG: hypothetical protein JRI68_03005 [Deltaproteobacteria bacterium]|nr:hypothetical protein [Deltaproteobacteria bacterium]